MATITSLPPQAYTRDTLVKAIEWLGGQPASVREAANSADLVVSFYLQSKRRHLAHLEAPVSGENFKSDLKSLAEDLKRFEHNGQSFHQVNSPLSPAPPPPQPQVVSPPHPTTAQRHEYEYAPPPPPPPAPTRAPSWAIDQRSLAGARELQQRLNLSSEHEAIRMLVTLGIERARTLFPV